MSQYNRRALYQWAEAYRENGLHLLFRAEDQTWDESSPVFGTGDYAPANTCLAFAVELYLKMVKLLEEGSWKGGHDLFEIFDSLEPQVKEQLISRYKANYRLNSSEREPEGGMSYVRKRGESQDGDGDSSEKAEVIHPDDDIESVLKSIGGLFTEGRYLFEHASFKVLEDRYIDHKLMYKAMEAIRGHVFQWLRDRSLFEVKRRENGKIVYTWPAEGE
jgi:HEPN domain-containing protein